MTVSLSCHGVQHLKESNIVNLTDRLLYGIICKDEEKI